MIDEKLDTFARQAVETEYAMDVWDQNPSLHILGLKDGEVSSVEFPVPDFLHQEGYPETLAVVFAFMIAQKALPNEVQEFAQTRQLAGVLMLSEAHMVQINLNPSLDKADQLRMAEAEATLYGTPEHHPQAQDAKVALLMDETDARSFVMKRNDGGLMHFDIEESGGAADIVVRALYSAVKLLVR